MIGLGNHLNSLIVYFAGESLCGEISCQKNRVDPRSLHITLTIDGYSSESYLMS